MIEFWHIFPGEHKLLCRVSSDAPVPRRGEEIDLLGVIYEVMRVRHRVEWSPRAKQTG